MKEWIKPHWQNKNKTNPTIIDKSNLISTRNNNEQLEIKDIVLSKRTFRIASLPDHLFSNTSIGSSWKPPLISDTSSDSQSEIYTNTDHFTKESSDVYRITSHREIKEEIIPDNNISDNLTPLDSSFEAVLDVSSGYEEDIYDNDSDTMENNSLSTIISKIFDQIPYENCENYLEQFKYKIITSDLLSSTNLKHRQILLKKKTSSTNFVVSTKKSYPTIYGRLYFNQRNNICIFKSIRYRESILSCYYLLRRLSISKKHASRRIVLAILILLYITFKQELFFLYYYILNLEKNLNEIIEKFNNFENSIHFLFIRYKEFTVYKPLTDVLNKQNNHFDYDPHPLLNELLSSNLDQMFFQLDHINKLFIQQYILKNNTILSSIENHFDIFNLNIIEYINYSNYSINKLEYKIKRFLDARKLFFCCLLSVCDIVYPHYSQTNITSSVLFNLFNNKTEDEVTSNEISNKEGNFEKSFKNIITRFKETNDILKQFNKNLSHITETLNTSKKLILREMNNKSLYPSISSYPKQNHNITKNEYTNIYANYEIFRYNEKITNSIQKLQMIEKYLMKKNQPFDSNNFDNIKHYDKEYINLNRLETKEYIKGTMINLLKLWTERDDVEESYDHYIIAKGEKYIKSNKNNRRHFSLSALKKPSEFSSDKSFISQIPKRQRQQPIPLEKPILLEEPHNKEQQSIFSNNVFTNANVIGDINSKKTVTIADDIREFSENELKDKLNQVFSIFQ
ncbi:hypothetical protein TBLA_0B07290 [Henningerozyma blattae CBS 6284]|uniref:Inheritance of peroxisomes protein 2 n=1 Tax=Henningerozyma blattae (strain ATCC 34711 / CBS 6284 / DSM 70876 / NBRC 10599 / NRRL Y-10934 / UCD 77-7) TaxID=1071380 RepID=I2GZJ5_HENB6|nr:hypothetical protein TBLA_0B07290 [Tetrapisispora blattae CBS 6284]CCH59547.1 hypothetical protein TBLA_0B07290 [Tetrapisispora blattae CBS 6284]